MVADGSMRLVDNCCCTVKMRLCGKRSAWQPSTHQKRSGDYSPILPERGEKRRGLTLVEQSGLPRAPVRVAGNPGSPTDGAGRGQLVNWRVKQSLVYFLG
jgi:hypothetical protein